MALKKVANTLNNRSLVPYDGVDVSAGAATGEVVWEGPLLVGSSIGSANNIDTVIRYPGYVQKHTVNAVLSLLPLYPGVDYVSTTTLGGALGGLQPGFKYSWKGFHRTPSLTRANTGYEPWGVGVQFNTVLTGQVTSFGNTAEVTRDDEATIGVVVVTGDNVSVNRYNNAAAGDASYTDADSGAVARDVPAMTTGFDWELVAEAPSTMNSFDDLLVTAKVRDDGGTLRTFFSAATPTGTTAIGANSSIMPVMMLNQFGAWCESLWCKIEKAA